MKVRLMHPDRDFAAKRPLPGHADDLESDLALDKLVAAMATDDQFIADVARNALLNGPGNDAATLRWRQAAVRDALEHPKAVRAMYATVNAAFEQKRKSYWGFSTQYPSSILYSAIEAMKIFVRALRALREIADAQAAAFRSPAFCGLFDTLQHECDDDYLARVDAYLAELKFPGGALISAQLGDYFESARYTLRKPGEDTTGWLARLLDHVPSTYTVRVAPRDMIGAKTLREMRDRGIHGVADALAQAVDHIDGFLETLREQLAFQLGCINLHESLTGKNLTTCFPELAAADTVEGFRASALRDTALALVVEGSVVGNTIEATGKRLVVVTGANQGGKSTFLRSFGQAVLMAQAGMFVTAEAFSVAPCSGLFTHYKREEDASMREGKLDEELARIGQIADAIRPGAWLLLNESFASTNEREGSELARQVVSAMLERGIRVAFVTHLHAFAQKLYAQQRDEALFLRAERLPDGKRTFRLQAGEPRETSYGGDLYREVFGTEAGATESEASAEPDAMGASR